MDYNKAYDIIYEYYETARLDVLDLEKKVEGLEIEISEKTELYSRLADFEEDDTIIFSPHSRYSDSIQEKEAAYSYLESIKLQVEELKKELSTRRIDVDNYSFVLKLLESNTKSESELSNGIDDSELKDDISSLGIKSKLQLLYNLLPSDPMRVKVELGELLK